jgi:hypothetical protein
MGLPKVLLQLRIPCEEIKLRLTKLVMVKTINLEKTLDLSGREDLTGMQE